MHVFKTREFKKMPRFCRNSGYGFPYILFCISLWLSACTRDNPVLSTATINLQKSVMQTLVAHAVQSTLTPWVGWGENAPGKQHAVEITPEPVKQQLPTLVPKPGAIPDEHYIRDIWGHRQYFPLGCEVSAVRDWAQYFGIEINEFNFQYELPISDNPDLGFVGSVEDPWGQVPPFSYGVHAAPIAQVLHEKYVIPAKGVKGLTLVDIKREIASGQPVIVWVIGNCVGGIPHEYTDNDGNTVTVAAYEHVVIVTGYNVTHIRYMNNGKFYDIPNEFFLNSWGVLGNMGLYLE